LLNATQRDCHAAPAEQPERAQPARCRTRTAKPGKSPRGCEAAVLACRSLREAEATERAGAAVGKVLCGVRNPGAAALWRGSVHVVRTDAHGWTRGLAPAEAGACLPALGHATRDGAAGQACEPRRAVRLAPLRARALAREPLGAVWGPAWGSGAGADTCAPPTPRESPESGAGTASSRCPLSPPGAWGSPPGSERSSGGAPRHLGLGLGAQTPASSPHLRGRRGMRAAPRSLGVARGGGQNPHPGAAREETVRQKLSVPSSLPELDSGGLRGRRREERKGGREERGLGRSATLLAAWPGWCSLGVSEHAHWGGIKGGQPERPACLLARGAASREQRAVRQRAPPTRPGGRSQ